jgi:hypothetical protein
MRCLMSQIAAILFILPGTCPEALEYPNDLAKWFLTKELDKWKDRGEGNDLGDPRLDAAQSDANHHWVVYLRAGRPSARLKSLNRLLPPPLPFEIKEGTAAEGLKGRRFNVKVDDGWIVSFDGGEWGAGLWWFSPDGGRRYKISSKDGINGFFRTEAGLLALEGSSHGMSRGRIIRIGRGADGRWTSKVFSPLPEEPFAAVKDADGSLIVATHDRLLRVHPATRKVDVMIRDAFWTGLSPNSMIIAQGAVFIGMQHGVAKVEKKGKAYRAYWLVPFPQFDQVIGTRKECP